MPDIDLTIPDSAPGLKRGKEYANRALYTMIPLSEDQLNEACEDVFAKEERDLGLPTAVYPAPNPFVSSTSLREIFDHHLTIDESKWDTNYFLVITSEDWRSSGVLLVTMGLLNDDKPDAAFTNPEFASLAISSLGSGNESWFETVENSWGTPRDGRTKGTGKK
jgi:hypothetical protein